MNNNQTTFTRLNDAAQASKEEMTTIMNAVDFYLRFALIPSKVADIETELSIITSASQAVNSVQAQSLRKFSNETRWTSIKKKADRRYKAVLKRRDIVNIRKAK